MTAIQNRYSLMARWHETLFPVVGELGVAYVEFPPMASGFLTGRYNQNSTFEGSAGCRSFMPQYTSEGMKRGQVLLELPGRLAAEKSATPADFSGLDGSEHQRRRQMSYHPYPKHDLSKIIFTYPMRTGTSPCPLVQLLSRGTCPILRTEKLFDVMPAADANTGGNY